MTKQGSYQAQKGVVITKHLLPQSSMLYEGELREIRPCVQKAFLQTAELEMSLESQQDVNWPRQGGLMLKVSR